MRHLAYLLYLLDHKSRVLVHSALLGVPMRGITHDLSKFTPLEWLGIGRQFFPSSVAEKAGNATLFREAKAHHRRANEHEIEHWYRSDGTTARIPEEVLRETVADWAAFQGCAFSVLEIKKLAAKSYSRWAKNYKLHPETRSWLTTFLRVTADEA